MNHLKRNDRKLHNVVPCTECLSCALCSSVYHASIFSRKFSKEKQLEEKESLFLSFIPIFLNSRVDIAHLCLYNLSVIHKKKYFDSELELMAYINENWDRLHPGEVSHWNTFLVFLTVHIYVLNVSEL